MKREGERKSKLIVAGVRWDGERKSDGVKALRFLGVARPLKRSQLEHAICRDWSAILSGLSGERERERPPPPRATLWEIDTP